VKDMPMRTWARLFGCRDLLRHMTHSLLESRFGGGEKLVERSGEFKDSFGAAP